MEPVNELVAVPTGHLIHVEHHLFEPGRPTFILVNGALSTTTSFRGTVKFLRPYFNVVLYDLPCYGNSRNHNLGCAEVTHAEEVRILRALIDRYKVDHVYSVSWGGMAALEVLVTRPPSVKSAVICSFSPQLNPAMHDYISGAARYLENGDPDGAASWLNATVGKYLPRLLKLYNHRYLVELKSSQKQILFHIQQIRSMLFNDFSQMRQIATPMLFINGEMDEFTTASDIRSLAEYIPQAQFDTIPDTGHFLDLEGKRSWELMKTSVIGFMLNAGTGSDPLSIPAALRHHGALPELDLHGGL